MRAVILAGGKGTRLRPLTYTRAKPMIPLLNKPAMEHIIAKLPSQGFDEVIITTNYQPHQITDYLGDGSKWGVDLKVIQEKEPLGTAGSVKNASEHLDGTFAVIQGDNISDIDVGALFKKHKKMGGMATISLMEVEDVSHFGIAELSGSRIVRFKEKPKHDETFSNLANAGIYILEPEVLDMIPLDFYDFSKNLFPRMLEEKKTICGAVVHDFWRDIGRPEDYLAAMHHLLKAKSLIPHDAKVVESEIIESSIGSGCTISGSKIVNSAVFESTMVSKGSKVKNCIIGGGCKIGENVDIWPGAVIGDRVHIGNNVVIKGTSRIGPDITITHGEICDGVMLPDDIQEIN